MLKGLITWRRMCLIKCITYHDDDLSSNNSFSDDTFSDVSFSHDSDDPSFDDSLTPTNARSLENSSISHN